MTTELKPLLACPFCGGEAHAWEPTAKVTDDPKKGGRLYPVVNCCSCWAEMAGRDGDFTCESAVTRWNRRAS